jgi:uncharacterized protein (DUF433 family)
MMSGFDMGRPNSLEVPNYTLEEACRYLHVPIFTLRYWVIGADDAAPLTTVFKRKPLLLSFKNLIECYVLESLRNVHGIGLRTIRRDIEDLRQYKPSKYPLAEYQLNTRGRSIYLEDDGDELLNLTQGRQPAFGFMRSYIKRVERDIDGTTMRLFPFMRKQHISNPASAPRVVVIDPAVSFGMPVLVDSRISSAFLLSRYRGGATIPKLAADYGRQEAEIEAAIKLEKGQAA